MSSFTIIIGPCALESIEQVRPLVHIAKKHGLTYFRANIFKPRTSPQSFQGLGDKGLPILRYLIEQGMQPVCEAGSKEQLELLRDYASIIQIGARNMQNFELLKIVGKTVGGKKTVMLKRGFANNMNEWLSSASYLEQSGIPKNHILLCERGSRHAASPQGVCLDLGLAEKVRQETNYKVIIDPSHGTRESSLVLPLAKAALAMAFDGIMVETHPHPSKSLVDSQQAVHPTLLDKFLSRELSTKKHLGQKKEEVLLIN